MFSLMVHEDESPLLAKPDLLDGSISTAVVEGSMGADSVALDDSFVFPLEKSLEEFILSNWDKTVLGKIPALHVEDEESREQCGQRNASYLLRCRASRSDAN